jgi:hypothetical protein
MHSTVIPANAGITCAGLRAGFGGHFQAESGKRDEKGAKECQFSTSFPMVAFFSIT